MKEGQPHNEARSEIGQRKTKVVWTVIFDPFEEGQEVLATEMVLGEPIAIHDRFFAHLVRSPSGLPFVIDAQSGAILGNDWARVKGRIATLDRSYDHYIERARKGLDLVHNVPKMGTRLFWERLLAA